MLQWVAKTSSSFIISLKKNLNFIVMGNQPVGSHQLITSSASNNKRDENNILIILLLIVADANEKRGCVQEDN